MRFEMLFSCDNPAFQPDPSREVQRILANAANSVRTVRVKGGPYKANDWQSVYDSDGNSVGMYRLTDEEES